MISFLLTLRRLFQALRGAWQEPYFRSTLLLAVATLISGTLFYSAIEGWRALDALYFSVMTLTTIGYGDLHPTTDFSKIFTMIYALVGIGIFIALATQLAQALLKKDDDDE